MNERAKLVKQLLNVLQYVMADLRASRQRTNACVTRSTDSRGSRVTRNQAQHATTAQPEPFLGTGTAEAQGVLEGQQDSPHSCRWGKSVAGRCRPLTPDAQFKGYEDVLVQDVLFRSDNVLFHKEKFYSLSQHMTYLAA